ncbi:MAG: DUF4982 domain-containing protein [Pedobacter sp.]|nr:DUF4982 domain-containing protein [Chitinophagaceae bacterium]
MNRKWQNFKQVFFVSIMLMLAFNGFAQRTITSFDANWKFIKEDAKGAEKSDFNDAAWRSLNVPHDWMIEGPYDRNNPTGRGGGYLPSGIGWYRKTFTVDDVDAKKLVSIEFDGVMANSEVYLNGKLLGKRPYGYISFGYDISKFLNFGKGKINIIAVRADNSVQPASRYYTGAGIYRHVRLVTTNPVHIEKWGVFVTTQKVESTKATIKVISKVINESKAAADYAVQTTISDAANKTVVITVKKLKVDAGKSADLSQEIEVLNPKLWNLESPYLYTVSTKVLLNDKVVDDAINTFGIREAKFEAATGFWLNGKNIKMKGVCLHHDGGAVGAAVPIAVWEERFKILKAAGANSIRTSHNPVAPEFLDLCDKMGFLVMDETFDTWTAAKANGEKGYNLIFKDWWERDTKDMVLRDRNHPSIVIYSVGNEIHDDLSYPDGYKRYKDQQDVVHQIDNSRPVTMALFRPANSKVYTSGFAAQMEVVGQNYRENELVAAHEAHPEWKVIGTENGHTLQAWLALRDKPFMAGQFLWTGIDYLGEADWPAMTNAQAFIDRSNGWRPLAYQRQSWWSEKPMVKIVRKYENMGAGAWVSDWTPTDFDTYDDAKVNVYSNCDEVELFLNGTSLGSKPKPKDDSPRAWDVTFAKGTIKAVAKNNGKEVAIDEMITAGKPSKILLTANKTKLANSWDDVVFITATVVDDKGVPCPNLDNLIKFSTTGSGFVSAVDNGNIATTELYQTNERKLYNGRCIAIIKSNTAKGSIIIKATAEGLKEGSISLEVIAAKP